jgi:ABC-type thiamine transport system substrate-binding protein
LKTYLQTLDKSFAEKREREELVMRSRVQLIIPIAVGVLIAACAGPSTAAEYLWPKILNQLTVCASQHGYDLETAQQLPESSLGKGELKWRACAYQAIETKMVPDSIAPDLLRQLIREDKDMTAQIVAGKSTRSARKARATEILSEIHRREDAQRVKERRELENQMRRYEESLVHNRGARRAVMGRF